MKLLIATLLALAKACTYVEIPYPGAGKEIEYMISRTMEFSNVAGRVSYNIEAVPTHVSGGKYAFVGPASIFDFPVVGARTIFFEAMNEVGLTASALELDESIYEDEAVGANASKPAVTFEDVLRQLVMHCDSVNAALSFLESISVVRGHSPESAFLRSSGLHWALADASGRSVVVEYLQGNRVVSENAPRVLTNDPNLEWHWRNLNTYVNLNPDFPTQNDFLQVELDHGVGSVPRTVGHGWNLAGLPGDSSSPSRFVRVFYLRGYALRAAAPTNSSDAIVLGTALLNNVFLISGSVAPKAAMDGLEYTPYGVLKSPAERKMMIRGYRNTQWRLIDLANLDLTVAQTWPLEDGSLGVADITRQGSAMVAADIPAEVATAVV